MLMQHFLVLTLAFGPAGHHYCGLRRLGGLSHVFWQVVCLILSNWFEYPARSVAFPVQRVGWF